MQSYWNFKGLLVNRDFNISVLFMALNAVMGWDSLNPAPLLHLEPFLICLHRKNEKDQSILIVCS